MALALLLVALALALAPRKMLLFGRLSGMLFTVKFLIRVTQPPVEKVNIYVTFAFCIP
jgi:hypothetical protein